MGHIPIGETVQQKREELTGKPSRNTSCQFLGSCLSCDMLFREMNFYRQEDEQHFLSIGMMTVHTRISWLKINSQSVQLCRDPLVLSLAEQKKRFGSLVW